MLAQVLLLNVRRGSEAARLILSDGKDRHSWIARSQLSKSGKKLLSTYSEAFVMGKGYQWLPAFFPARCEAVLETLTDSAVRQRVYFTIEEPIFEEHEKNMARFRKHQFNIRNQYAAYRKIREEQADGEALIHIDFADNYICMYDAESQSLHFGGAHDQAILHTGVAYVNKHVAPFCTIRDLTVHSPEAICAYLSPVFPWLEQQVPQGIRKLNVFSDGPVTQYRQKKNFLVFCQLGDNLPHIEEAS